MCRLHWFEFSAWLKSVGLWGAWCAASNHWPYAEKTRLYRAWRRAGRVTPTAPTAPEGLTPI